MALVQWAARAARTEGVFFGQGPSSKVSTISPSRRKSWLLKCSKPKPGPPVVSISTVRAIPRALGLLQVVAAGAGAACATTVGASVCSTTAAFTASARALVPIAGACPSPGAANAGAVGPDTEVLCRKIVPNTAAHKMIASADAIAARRMSDLQAWDFASVSDDESLSFRLHP